MSSGCIMYNFDGSGPSAPHSVIQWVVYIKFIYFSYFICSAEDLCPLAIKDCPV